MTASRISPGCSLVTITFIAPASAVPSAFTVLGSYALNGNYGSVANATITGGSGLYQATFTTCSTEFYRIVGAVGPVTAPTITGITATQTSPGCAVLTINFVAPGNPASSAFTLLGAADLNGPYAAAAGATITGGSGIYQATLTTCSTEFFQILQSGQ